MRRLALFTITACLLSVAASPAWADGGKGKEDANANGRDGGETVQGSDAAQSTPRVGSFSVDASSSAVSGKYLSFTYNQTGISAFSIGGTRIFDAAIAPGPGAARSGASETTRDAEIRVQGPRFTFVAHDVPTAPSRLTSEGPATLTFAPDARLVSLEDDGRISFTVGSLSGQIRAENARLAGNVLTTRGDVLVFLDNARAGIESHRGEVAAAIGKGHVGAEATLSSDTSGVHQDVISYGNVTMTTTKLEKGNVTLLVEGHGLEGRILVLDIDGRVLGAQKASELVVRLDNMTVQPADNLTDILDPDNDGLLPEYYVVFDPGAQSFQLLVSVPHYSVHTLSVLTSIELPPPSVIVGIVAGVALLVPSAFALFRRK